MSSNNLPKPDPKGIPGTQDYLNVCPKTPEKRKASSLEADNKHPDVRIKREENKKKRKAPHLSPLKKMRLVLTSNIKLKHAAAKRRL